MFKAFPSWQIWWVAEWGPGILYWKYLIQTNAQFLIFLRKKKYSPRFYVTIKRSASIHLSNGRGFGCCWSAKAELELKLHDKKKGSPGKQVFIVP